MSELKEKYVGEAAAQRLVQEIEDRFSPIGHTHSAEEVGADKSGSAAAALSLAKEHTNTEITKAQASIDDVYETKEDAQSKYLELTGKINSGSGGGGAIQDHDHNNLYYTKDEIETMEFINVDDIDAICGSSIQIASMNG